MCKERVSQRHTATERAPRLIAAKAGKLPDRFNRRVAVSVGDHKPNLLRRGEAQNARAAGLHSERRYVARELHDHLIRNRAHLSFTIWAPLFDSGHEIKKNACQLNPSLLDYFELRFEQGERIPLAVSLAAKTGSVRTFTGSRSQLEVGIEDTGIGSDPSVPASRGLELASMPGRARPANGYFFPISEPRTGVRFEVEPLVKQAK